MARYGAFLSYSRQDLEFARKLHAALESYRIPKNAGESDVADKPDRIAPIFRDQDEVSASPNLDATLKQALADSSALIVIASPNAAQSRWVNAEIEEFTRLGRAARIFVAVPPDTPEERGFKVSSIFPPALLQLGEPLAADFRKICDGWTLGKLKLIAGVARIDLVRLRDRDAARRMQRAILATVTSALVLGIVGITAFNWFQADRRARAERVERSVEAIRVNLQTDQAGVGLAFIESINRGDATPEVRAALDRISLFWRDQLTSPAQAVAAIPVGSVYSINGVSYFRNESGSVRMPVENAVTIFQRAGSPHVFFSDNTNRVYRVDSATGASTLIFDNPPSDFGLSEIFERPDGTVVLYGAGPRATMAGQHDIAFVLYPGGGNSGVIQGRVMTYLHANLDCTKIYYADGDKGYGAATPGASNPDYVQVLAQGTSTNARFPVFSFGVATLDPSANWREASFSLPYLDEYEEDSYAADWLDQRGPELRIACNAYAYEGSVLIDSDLDIQLPALRTDAWRQDDSLSQVAQWRNLQWSNPSALPDGGAEAPKVFGQTPGGIFAVYEYPSNFFATYHVCLQPNGGSTQCTEREVDGMLPLQYLREANLLIMDEVIDLTTMQRTAAPDFSASTITAPPDGRAIIAFTQGEISIYDYTPGAGASLARTYRSAEFEELEAFAAINGGDVLIATHEGRLMRVDASRQRIKWSIRDRMLQEAIGTNSYLTPGIHGIQLAVSPDGSIAVVLTHTSVRLYDTVLGAPLTPAFTFTGRSLRDPIIEVADDGAVIIRGADHAGNGGSGFARAAPQPRAEDADPACLYAARVVNGELQRIDIFGDPTMMQRCGFNAD